MKNLFLSLGIGLLLAGPSGAAELSAAGADCTNGASGLSCCSRCGRQCSCNKVCRVVCVVQEVKKTVWAVQCKEFCVGMPRLCAGKDCGDSASCGACDHCAAGQPCQAPPKCGPVRTKKELVRKEVSTKVPVYKCVVQNLCDTCCQQCGDPSTAGPASGVLMPAPAPPRAGPTPPALPTPPPLPSALRSGA